jgi:hypothetical protein
MHEGPDSPTHPNSQRPVHSVKWCRHTFWFILQKNITITTAFGFRVIDVNLHKCHGVETKEAQQFLKMRSYGSIEYNHSVPRSSKRSFSRVLRISLIAMGLAAVVIALAALSKGQGIHTLISKNHHESQVLESADVLFD